jgi:hypothetical protein
MGVAPMPGPVGAIRVAFTGTKLNVAVTLRVRVISTVQGPVPVQSPLQPANVEPAAGTAVNVTEACASNGALQVLPQSMPAGSDVTVPFPMMGLELTEQ